MKKKTTKVKEIRCTYCGYQWVTKAKTKYVTCPSCQKKTVQTKLVVGDKADGKRKE